ncbi:hypothetical protein PLICRDRAFT_312482 [Plicaturopsis crispa FD-325 SS-3]|nr:hypothetical protein PLICRDRAFT_312482 [Plicaturopsis crispa FD-325 SS-3]
MSPIETIPEELLLHILTLAPHPVSPLLRVSKAWNRIATPLLYRAPRIRSPVAARAFHTTLVAAPDLARLVRALVLAGAWLEVVPLCPKLEGLDMALDVGEGKDGEVGLVGDLRGLGVRTLTVRKPLGVYLTHARPRAVLRALAEAIPTWACLVSISLRFVFVSYPTTRLAVRAYASCNSHRPVRFPVSFSSPLHPIHYPLYEPSLMPSPHSTPQTSSSPSPTHPFSPFLPTLQPFPRPLSPPPHHHSQVRAHPTRPHPQTRPLIQTRTPTRRTNAQPPSHTPSRAPQHSPPCARSSPPCGAMRCWSCVVVTTLRRAVTALRRAGRRARARAAVWQVEMTAQQVDTAMK